MLDPCRHAEAVTGQKQSAAIDLWPTLGFAAAVSDVTGPRLYDYGVMNVPTVAITLYDVKRHVLIENGRVRRDGRVRSGRFRIGQPGLHVTVDAVPDVVSGKLVLLYLGQKLLNDAGCHSGSGAAIELADNAWDTDDPFLRHVALRLAENAGSADPMPKLFREQLALSLAYHVVDRYSSAAPSSVQPDSRRLSARALADVIECVRADPSADLAIGELSHLVGLSPSHLIRAFKATTGLTPHRFVMRERVAMAREMLAEPGVTIADVALSCGFSSQSHMGVAFRSIVGTTPAAYRRMRRK